MKVYFYFYFKVLGQAIMVNEVQIWVKLSFVSKPPRKVKILCRGNRKYL